jgi:hypothetical protein
MELSQRHLFNRTAFHFGEDEFRYTLKDGSGTRSFSVDYWNFNPDFTDLEESNVWWRNAGLIWVAIGLVQVGARYAKDGALGGSLWLSLGVICLLVYRFARTRYTVHAGRDFTIVLIKDKQHAQILAELTKRRQGRLARALGEIDFEAEPEREIAKFAWLAEQGAITKEEAGERIARVRQAAFRRGDGDSTPTIN